MSTWATTLPDGSFACSHTMAMRLLKRQLAIKEWCRLNSQSLDLNDADRAFIEKDQKEIPGLTYYGRQRLLSIHNRIAKTTPSPFTTEQLQEADLPVKVRRNLFEDLARRI